MSDIYGGYVNQQALKALIGAKGGVNPIATVVPRKDLYQNALEIRERQQVYSRYTWSNLPVGLDAKMMERILYYRGRIVLFRYGDVFYSTPFALSGSIDLYGRYQTVTPLTFNGSIETDNDGNKRMNDGEFISGLQLKVAYDENLLEGKECVILNDYGQGISEFIEPRYSVNKILNESLAETLVLIRHNLISSARVYSVRCLDEGQKEAVEQEFNDMENDILNVGKRIFPVVSATELKEFLNDKTLETQQYFECYVSLDNLRENLIGIENNGVFKKKERVLKGEQEIEAGSADLVHADGLAERQKACTLFNAIFGTNMWCETSDTVEGVEDEEGDEEEDGDVHTDISNDKRDEQV